MISKTTAKRFLGEIPLTAETYWYLRQAGRPIRTGYSLRNLQEGLPEWTAQAADAARRAPRGKDILIFATLHYWISHAALLGLALGGMGHRVNLGFLPFNRWQDPVNRFDVRRQNLYSLNVLKLAAPMARPVSFLDLEQKKPKLPKTLHTAVEQLAVRDTQYTLQIEEISKESELYQLRYERNLMAAQAAFSWLRNHQPDLVIVPNGSIQEFGSVYQVARYLEIPTVTYEFGEQRGRLWLAQNSEVMRQQTDELWQARGGKPISEEQRRRVRDLYSARRQANLWGNFARRWQGVPNAGGEAVRAALDLDQRPIVLLATNVIGDSLTLGRQVFSDSMTEWLVRTVHYFAGQSAAQLVVRIHPGEQITKGPSVAAVVERALPGGITDHIHLVAADAPVNTYDLIEIASMGLVYTTTAGLEMAMSGLPVIAIGQTHYRGRGFTLDPDSWETYFELLGEVIASPEKYLLSQPQVDSAWEYAYRFFFEYPFPFPWHLLHLWEDVREWPVGRVLGEEGLAQFGPTLRGLAGEGIDWSK